MPIPCVDEEDLLNLEVSVVGLKLKLVTNLARMHSALKQMLGARQDVPPVQPAKRSFVWIKYRLIGGIGDEPALCSMQDFSENGAMCVERNTAARRADAKAKKRLTVVYRQHKKPMS